MYQRLGKNTKGRLSRILEFLLPKSLALTDQISLDEKNSLSSRRVNADPYPYYTKLREKGSVHYLPDLGFWLVVKYDEVLNALKKPQIFANLPFELDMTLVGANPPAHTRVRRILAPYFSSSSIEIIARLTKAKVSRLITRKYNGIKLDVVKDFAQPLTEEIVADLLGFNDEELESLRRKIGSEKHNLELYLHPLAEFCAGHIRRLMSNPGDDLCSKLLINKEDGLSVEETISITKLLWVAGTTTTSMLLSTCILLLLKMPKLQNLIRLNCGLLPQFIEETLRYDAPEQMGWRVTTTDTEIEGVKIPANSQVRLCLGAANRDAKKFPNPDEFLLTRSNSHEHLSFSAGPHYCLGASLSRLIVRQALEEFLTQTRNLQMTQSLEDLNYLPSYHFRCLEKLIIDLP